jgi:hypothetical protein
MTQILVALVVLTALYFILKAIQFKELFVLCLLFILVGSYNLINTNNSKQIALDKANNEIENLRYQLNQCKLLYVGN